MVNPAPRECYASLQVVSFQVRHFVKNLSGVKARREKI